jgi:hypothetical protein
MCANQPLEREIAQYVGCHTHIIKIKYHGNMNIPSRSKNNKFANKPYERASGPYVCCNKKTRYLEALMTIHALNGIMVAHKTSEREIVQHFCCNTQSINIP